MLFCNCPVISFYTDFLNSGTRVEGFEPPTNETKTRRLTTWPHPISNHNITLWSNSLSNIFVVFVVVISFVTFLGEQSCGATRKNSRQDCCCFGNKTQEVFFALLAM